MGIAESAEINRESPTPGHVERRGTILLVEDEDFVRDVTCEVLESAGYRVIAARNAAEAAEMFERYSRLIELVITDMVMPGRDGRTLAEDLLSRCPGLKVIVSSGYPIHAASFADAPANLAVRHIHRPWEHGIGFNQKKRRRGSRRRHYS